jgi:predicted phosphodiesterase
LRIAIITDIHEDIRNLEKAISAIRGIGCDSIVCLGDITGYSPVFHHHTSDASACIDMLQSNGVKCLAGNHDLYTARRLPSYHLEQHMPDDWYELSYDAQMILTKNSVWLYEDEVMPDLNAGDLLFLDELPEECVYEAGSKRIVFTHFFKPDVSGICKWFPKRTRELRHHFRWMESQDCRLAFVGHCHPEGSSLIRRYDWSDALYNDFEPGPEPAIVLCPPIVSGLKSTGFLIYDGFQQIITPHYFH